MGAQYGHSDSMFVYVSMLENGKGCQQNPEEAIKYYKLAISKGNKNAMYEYALMLHKGHGIKQDIEEAKKYYQLAYEHGNYKGYMALTLLQTVANNATNE